MLSVPTEASAFLGMVAICMTCLFVFYLYLTKKFCFNTIGGFPCCDKPLNISKDKASKDLVDAFSYDDALDSSTDSEDELLQRLKRSASNQINITRQSSISKNEPLISREFKPELRSDKRFNTASTSRDLISLAEKGRIGKNGSSEGSGSSEAGSGDNEDESRRSRSSFAKDKALNKLNKSETSESSSPIKFRDHHKSQYNTAFEKCESDAQSSTSQDFSQHFSQSESHSVTKCGSLEISYAFDAPTKKLMVTVFEANNIPCKERGGANQIHVRLVLLPQKRHKHKTKIKSTGNPIFNETFTFARINPEEVMGLGIRFRVYGTAFARREQLIGESIIVFSSSKPQQQETRLWLTLEPRSCLASDSRSEVSSLARSDSTGSAQSMQSTSLPEMLLGLAYNGTTGRLNVSVIKGSQFRTITMTRAPDTYIKLSLVSSSGQEIARSKTSVRRGQPNPLFKETFIFQIALFQLPDVTLMISVYNKRSMNRKEMIGWFSLGFNSSGDEELSHWNDMRDSKGEQVCRWHVLLDS
ncbi:unnamed protein product [Medioppia subpectinata]|uniref:C2 domain-containing protein n=1 Tax=Medioppia subpectinata TaxID=1979941 RepID=A0A7R9PUG3_9ACAR|nr:unnamed protein product [Medioppia subpectinata]CAG2101545.1 unnamed protein product [Medioppia subpectinata]